MNTIVLVKAESKEYDAPWRKDGGKVRRDVGGRFASGESSSSVRWEKSTQNKFDDFFESIEKERQAKKISDAVDVGVVQDFSKNFDEVKRAGINQKPKGMGKGLMFAALLVGAGAAIKSLLDLGKSLEEARVAQEKVREVEERAKEEDKIMNAVLEMMVALEAGNTIDLHELPLEQQAYLVGNLGLPEEVILDTLNTAMEDSVQIDKGWIAAQQRKVARSWMKDAVMSIPSDLLKDWVSK
jgi:hypothetical protein